MRASQHRHRQFQRRCDGASSSHRISHGSRRRRRPAFSNSQALVTSRPDHQGRIPTYLLDRSRNAGDCDFYDVARVGHRLGHAPDSVGGPLCPGVRRRDPATGVAPSIHFPSGAMRDPPPDDGSGSGMSIPAGLPLPTQMSAERGLGAPFVVSARHCPSVVTLVRLRTGEFLESRTTGLSVGNRVRTPFSGGGSRRGEWPRGSTPRLRRRSGPPGSSGRRLQPAAS